MGLGGGGPLNWLGMAGADQEFVDFGTRTKAFLDPITQARDAGTLTFDQVEKAQAQLEEEYDAYKFKLDQGSLSGDPKVTEGFRTASGSYVERWRNTLSEEAKRLGPDPLSASPVPTLENILGGESARQRATRMAEQQRKRSASGGRLATILGNYQPSTGLKTEQKGLTGY